MQVQALVHVIRAPTIKIIAVWGLHTQTYKAEQKLTRVGPDSDPRKQMKHKLAEGVLRLIRPRHCLPER